MQNERKSDSVSAEDLKRIIKGMIKKALNDNEHMMKLHRKVCEEWYTLLGKKNHETMEKATNVLKNPSLPGKMQNFPKIQVKNHKLMEKNHSNPQNKAISSKFLNKKAQKEDFKRLEKVQKPLNSDETLRKILKEQQENALGRKQRAWEFYHQQKRLHKGWKMRKNLEFNFWLNQLDSVLHQKYLREHRHQVQSFYCQPIYYGTEIPETLFKNYYMQYAFSQ